MTAVVTRLVVVGVLAACALALVCSLEFASRRVSPDPSVSLETLRVSLAAAGLRQRRDVVLEMNDREVALGFSRVGCEGLLLVAILPHTAQGWAHIAPRLDFSRFEMGYVYKGVWYQAVPRIERLAVRLLRDLTPHKVGSPPQVVAIAEAGRCGLALSAAPALDAVSRGVLSLVGEPESPINMGAFSL